MCTKAPRKARRFGTQCVPKRRAFVRTGAVRADLGRTVLVLLLAYWCYYWPTSATSGLLQLPLAYCCYYWPTAATTGLLLLLPVVITSN